MTIIIRIALLTALICMGGSALGAILASFIKKDSKKTVAVFLAFAGGLTLGIVCFDLIPEAIEGFDDPLGILWVLLCVLSGYGIIYMINYVMSRRNGGEHCCHCHCHEGEESKTPRQLFFSGIIMAAAIAIHNLPVGMIIGASHSASGSDAITAAAVGLTVAIGIHNVPEGMAIALPLISGGSKKWRAVLITILTGLPTVVGAVIGYFIGSMNPTALAISLCFAAGAMLFVVFSELLPEAFEEFHSKLTSFAVTVGVLVAFVIIFT